MIALGKASHKEALTDINRDFYSTYQTPTGPEDSSANRESTGLGLVNVIPRGTPGGTNHK